MGALDPAMMGGKRFARHFSRLQQSITFALKLPVVISVKGD